MPPGPRRRSFSRVRPPSPTSSTAPKCGTPWKSALTPKRLGARVKVPQLSALGYPLVGGRLLPGNQGPVAQFMFQDSNGQRLTLYVRSGAGDSRETAFRFTQERGVSVFYWLDRKFCLPLSG